MTDITLKNIFDNIPDKLEEELFEDIITNKNFKLERIISDGHTTPKDFWYDQDKNEFVMVLSGSATILFDDNTNVSLSHGDYIIIPAHKKHRVEKTDSKTVWLALHY